MNGFSQPGIGRVVDAAARKGVKLDVTIFDESAHTDQEAAALIGVDLGQIVKALVFVAPRSGGRLAPLVCLVSARDRADTARLAAAAGEAFLRREHGSPLRDADLRYWRNQPPRCTVGLQLNTDRGAPGRR